MTRADIGCGLSLSRSPSSRWRRTAVARDEQAPPVGKRVARSSGAATRRLSSSVEIIRVRGPDAAHLAEVQLEAIREVLAWALTEHHRNEQFEEHQDRAA
jgi:hypothetical protein